MRTKFIALIMAACCLTAVSSCSKSEIEEKGKADANGQIEISVKGVLGEYKTEGTKASLVNNIRVGWSKDNSNKDKVLVFHKEKQKYLGHLVATVQNGDDRYATLSGTITAPEGGVGNLVFVHGTGLDPTSFDGTTTYSTVEMSLSSQGEKTPFLVYGTAPYVASAIDNIIIDFRFATSVVSTYVTGLPANKSVTKAELSTINTKCVLTIPASGNLGISGDSSGTITKTAGIATTNAEGQVLFEIAVPASDAATSDRSVAFTVGSENYTTTFSSKAIEAGRAYSAMSENHSVEGVSLNKTSTTIFIGASETLAATVYPKNSSQAVTWSSSDEAIATVNASTGEVKGIKYGTATITATSTEDSSIKATCTVMVDLEYVIIGGRKWATMNLGATTVAGSGETCYGDYYAWGETEPYYASREWKNGRWMINTWKSGKSGYNWDSYCGHTPGNAQNVREDLYGKNTRILKSENDAVKVKYPLSGWRMPTEQDFEDLYKACGGPEHSPSYYIKTNGSTGTTERGVYWCSSYNGVKGALFIETNGGPHLFFPTAAGDNSQYYWSSTVYYYIDDHDAYAMQFYSNKLIPQITQERFNGYFIRPVLD